MTRTKKIAILAIIAMVLCMLPAQMFAAASDADAESTRLAGLDRIETGLAVSHAGWDVADTVILAPSNQRNLVDALAAAPLAGQVDGPILLTPVDQLDPTVKARIKGLQAKTVYVVGAISDAVTAEVEALTNVSAVALKGADRMETAAKINELLTYPQGTFVVGYSALADALSVASYAAKNRYAIVVADQSGNLPAGQQLVGTKFYKIGGPTLVSDSVTGERIYGADRFETNLKVAQTLSYDYRRVYVANGFNNSLSDSLAVAPLAAQYGSFVALADNINNEVKAASFVNTKVTGATKVIGVGGVLVLSDILKAKVGIDKVVVESAEAINLKQIQVVFNKEVNETSVENASKYKLDDTALTTGGELEIDLQSDKKTVLITLGAANQLVNTQSYKFQIGSVIDGTGVESDVFDTTIKYTDTTVPYITEVKVLESKKLRVVFNEPVFDLGNTDDNAAIANDRIDMATSLFEVEGGVHPVTKATADLNKNAVELEISTALQQGQHEVTVKPNGTKITDFAGYAPVKHSKIFTMSNDTTAPTVTVKSADETEVRLVFSEPVVNVANANVRYRHTYNQDLAGNVNRMLGNQLGSAVAVSGTNETEWIIDFGSARVLPLGTVEFYIGYVSSTGDKIEDKFGNALPATNLTLNVVQDTAAPKVEAVVYVDKNTVDVKFDETVVGANISTNYTLKDSSSNKVNVTNAVKSGSVYRLTTADMKGGTYTLTVANIKDDSLKANMMSSTTISFNTTDNVAPTVDRVTIYDSRTKIRVYFSEDMLDDGLTVLQNYSYKVDNATPGTVVPTVLPAGTVINKIDNKTIEIVLKNAILNVDGDSTVAGNADWLSVSGALKDRAGNRINSALFTDTQIKTDQALDLLQYVADSAKATAPNKIEFKVNMLIGSADATKIDLDTNIANSGATPKSVSIVNDTLAGKATITLTLNADATNTSFAANSDIDLNDGAFTTILGDPVKFTGTKATAFVKTADIKDYARPSDIVGADVVTVDTDFDGQINGVVITYSEPIHTESVQAADYTVDSYFVTGVQAGYGGDSKKVFVKVTESGAGDSEVTPKVTQVGEVADDSAQHNVLGSQGVVTAVDAVAPVLLSAVVNYATGGAADFGTDVGDKLVLTYSEPVYAPVAGWADAAPTFGELNAIFTFSGAAFSDGTFTSPSIDTTGEALETITITVATAESDEIDGTETITTIAAGIQDVAGTAQHVGSVITPTYVEQ